MKPKFRYIRIKKKLFFCLDLSLSHYLKLYFSAPECAENIITTTLLGQFFAAKFLNWVGLAAKDKIFEVGFAGLWAIKVRGGFKVFDPYRKTTRKVFNDDVPQDVVKAEIEEILQISQLDFVATVYQSNIAEGWYEEELIVGKTADYFSPASTTEFIQVYLEDVAPYLVKLIAQQPSKSVSLGEYITGLQESLKPSMVQLNSTAPQTAQLCKQLIDESIRYLDAYRDKSISLVFSHGDFHLYNLFKTEDGLKIIDWEGLNQQSLSHDFFTYFFSHLWLDKTKDDFVTEIEQGMADLAKRLQSQYAELSAELENSAGLYLRIYYLERIHALLTVFHSKSPALEKWLKVYSRFNQALASAENCELFKP